MQAPADQGGQTSYSGGVYTRIIEHELLEFTAGLCDEHGTPIDPADLAAMELPEGVPAAQLHTVTFARRRDMTELTIVEHEWPMSQMYVYALAGLHQSIDKFADVLDAQP